MSLSELRYVRRNWENGNRKDAIRGFMETLSSDERRVFARELVTQGAQAVAAAIVLAFVIGCETESTR